MSLADNLKKIRLERGLSQAKLAKISGVTQQSLSRLESGVDKTSKFLPQLAAALKVPVAKLDQSYLSAVPTEEWAGLLRQAARAAVAADASLQQISDVLADEFHSSLAARLRRNIGGLPPEQQQSVLEAADKISETSDRTDSSRKGDI